MPVKIAVVMTGHPRMVAYGYKLLRDEMRLHDVDYTIFSNTWDSESDNKRYEVSTLDSNVLTSLKYHRSQNQSTYLKNIYEQYNIDSSNHELGLKAGQVLSMIDALAAWCTELQEFDYIIKTRWDHVLDTFALTELINNNITEFSTGSLCLNKGDFEVSGNTIYGTSNAWLSKFLPASIVLELIKTFVVEQQTTDWPAHKLWGYLFQKTNSSIVHKGDEYPIRPNALSVPVYMINRVKVMELLC